MARQITFTPGEAQVLWLGVEGRQSPKSEWGQMIRLSDKMKVHAKVNDDGEEAMLALPDGTVFPVFEGPLTLTLERDELAFALSVCGWFEEKGAGARLARAIESIQSKASAVLEKMDAKPKKKKAS